jgi:pimeloyl-ACP methyl ester carboxylesterase
VPAPERDDFEATGGDGIALRGWEQGEGPPIVLSHGITAHRDLVVHGSSHLARSGYRLISYNARSHGDSDAGAEGSHGYETLADDLEAVIAGRAGDGEGKPLLVGHSMGAHTILAAALRDPDRYAGLVVIGPVSQGAEPPPETLAYWDSLADGLKEGGVEGWMAAYMAGDFDPDWRETLERIARERMGVHEHLEALAHALREVPRSVPYDGLSALSKLDLPALVVGSRDEADPGHPRGTAELVARRLPDARLVIEEEGESPLAWQGGKLSREIEEFAGSAAVRERLGQAK